MILLSTTRSIPKKVHGIRTLGAKKVYVCFNALKEMSRNVRTHVKCVNLTCEPNENSNQSWHPRSLIRVFVIHMDKLCNLSYPICAQCRFVRSDLNLRWVYISEGTFSTHMFANVYISKCDRDDTHEW